MHMFKKLALAAAIASTPMLATALQPLDDATLAGVTGQDGITIKLQADLTVDVAIEDTSGAQFADGSVTDNGGFITLAGLGIKTGGTDGITIDIDSGSSGGNNLNGVLVVGVKVDEVTISNIDLGVAGSTLAQGDTNANVVPAGARVAADGITRAKNAIGTYTSIVAVNDITLTGVNLGIELGPEASQFLSLSTNGTLDIELDNFTLMDPQGGGSLAVEQIGIYGVDLDATVAITTTGLVATTTASNMDIAMMGVSPGSGVIGNLYLLNLDMAGTTIEISGR